MNKFLEAWYGFGDESPRLEIHKHGIWQSQGVNSCGMLKRSNNYRMSKITTIRYKAYFLKPGAKKKKEAKALRMKIKLARFECRMKND